MKHEFQPDSVIFELCRICSFHPSADVHDVGEGVALSLACDECPYIFTQTEIAAEDKSAWGHPCHGVKDAIGTVCESYRAPVAPIEFELNRDISRTLNEIQAEWREEAAVLLEQGKDLMVLVLGNRLLLEANLSGEYDAYKRMAKC